MACVLGTADAADLVLVEKGVSRAPIIVFKDAPPYTRRAGAELAEYIEKTSGAKPKVIEGLPVPIPEHAIWVGFQPKLKELFPTLDFDFKQPEEILIAANENHLVIAGRDRWNPEHLVVPGRNWTIEGKQLEYGTVNAVYTFLQDYLGVRWLWPGEVGEDIVKRDTISFAPFEYRYHPQFRERCHIFRLSALGDSRGFSHDWVRFQRLQLDSLQAPGGHPLANWFDKYHAEHPEYFALQPDGTRSGFPGPKEPTKAKLCTSNPAVWKQWLSNVAEDLQKDPNQTVFGASPNDSWNRGHCVCENCCAWDDPNGVMVRQAWQGVSKEWVSLSDRNITFANTLARLVKQRFPGQALYVAMSAYGDAYLRPPLKAVPDDNVIVSVVAGFFLRDEVIRPDERLSPEAQRQFFRDWAKITSKLRWRPNIGSVGGFHQGQPDVVFGGTADDFRFVADNNCIGMFFDTIWEFWPTQGPLYYLMAQMAWNPRQDWQPVMDDYYQRGFGPAAADIKAYWTLMEEARNRKEADRLEFTAVFDDALFAKADDLLDRADAALAGVPEIYRKRVAFVRAGLEFTRLTMDTRVLMARAKESKGEDKEAAEKVRAIWQVKEQIARENLMNYSFLRPGWRYAAGLHPDFP